jgi:hypothetical protein
MIVTENGLAMPRIVDIQAYDGFDRKVKRLGLTGVLDEVCERISAFEFLLAETRRGNSAAALRELLDARFMAIAGWTIVKSGASTGRSASAIMARRCAWGWSCRFPRAVICLRMIWRTSCKQSSLGI